MSTITGREAAATITSQRRAIEETIRGIDSQIASAEAVISQRTSLREDTLSKLAAIWLQDSGDYSRVVNTLHQVTARLQTIYTERAQRRNTVNAHIGELSTAESVLEGQITEARAQIERHEAEVSRIIQAVAADLVVDEAYTKLCTERDALTQQLSELATQESTITHECLVKQEAYDHDPLFSYLRHRGYGTDRYERGLLAFGDEWLANAIGYTEAKRHWDLLNDMPDHLERTRVVLTSKVNAIEVAINEAEARYEAHHGLVAAKAMRESAQSTKESLAEQLHTNRTTQEALRIEKASIDSGKDAFAKAAKRELKGALSDISVVSLREKANLTKGTEDNGLVDALEAAEVAINEQRKVAKGLIAQRSAEEERLNRLRSFESRFSSLDYDGSRARFDTSSGGGLDMGSLLLGYMAGTISDSAAFGRLESAHSVYREPSYSSSYGGGSSSSSDSYSSWSSSSSDSYSSSSSSSYDSGGGFGGGDSSSGGGF